MISSRSALVIAAVAMALVAGCGGATVTRTTNTTSVGKELEDLKKARTTPAPSISRNTIVRATRS